MIIEGICDAWNLASKTLQGHPQMSVPCLHYGRIDEDPARDTDNPQMSEAEREVLVRRYRR